MKQKLINNVVQGMLPFLNNAQSIQLQKVLERELAKVDVIECAQNSIEIKNDNERLVELFLSAKRIEGRSEKSLKYYYSTISTMLETVSKHVQEIETDDLREYLTGYQKKRQSSKVTIDNIRRILSSFFSWLEDEDYILKSPVRRIHKVKAASIVKETYTDEALEQMRDDCDNLRDLALIDMLASTGMRIGELLGLKWSDIDFENRTIYGNRTLVYVTCKDEQNPKYGKKSTNSMSRKRKRENGKFR